MGKEKNKKNTTGAVILYKKEVIALAHNDICKTHPLQAKFARIPGEAIYLHAEISAIAKALRMVEPKDLEKSTLMIARLKANGTWGCSKPCVGCARAIITFGFKNVYHT